MARLRSIAISLAASAAAALLISSGFAVADGTDADGDSVPDSTEIETQRTVAAAVTGGELDISSRLVSAPYEDRFQVSFKAGTFAVQYEQPEGGVSGYELELRNLFEWADTNGNGTIDGAEVLSSRTLGSSAFDDVQILHQESPSGDGGRVFNFTIPGRSGDVTLLLSVSERFLRLSGDRILSPMEVKLDLMIDHSFYHTAANVGIEMRIVTDDRFEVHETSWDDLHGIPIDRGAVNVTAGPQDRPATAFLSWSKTALADGRRVPVTVSNLDSEGGDYDLYFGFPAGGAQSSSRVEIVHDLSLGVGSALFRQILQRPPPPRGDVVLYAASLASVAFLVAATVVLSARRRRRREKEGQNP